MTVLGAAKMLGFVASAAVALSLLAPQASAQVTFERLLNSSKEPQNWMMYSGDYAGHRFSALEQINTSNAASLVPKWAYQTMAGGKFEGTPLVVDGILYGTGQDDRVFALDARSGRPIWQYQQALPVDIRPCCGRVNRGLAILGDKVFVATLDAHVIALDRKTGNVIWDVHAAAHSKGYSFTLASADSSMLTMRRRANANGGSTQFPVRESPATKPGKETRGKLAVRPRGSRGRTIRRRTRRFGQRETPRLRTAAKGARATIFTAIVCLHSIRTRGS